MENWRHWQREFLNAFCIFKQRNVLPVKSSHIKYMRWFVSSMQPLGYVSERLEGRTNAAFTERSVRKVKIYSPSIKNLHKYGNSLEELVKYERLPHRHNRL